MKALFQELLAVPDVQGVIYVSAKGELLFREWTGDLSDHDWEGLLKTVRDVREADMLFEEGRLYLRRAPEGYLLVLLGIFGSMAMVRLQCDLLLPSLEKARSARGLRGLFKRKK